MGLIAAFAGTALLLALMGTWRMFAHFPGYDDEGYILLSVRNYLEHGGLYGRVYSQYGPAFYALHDLLHRVTGMAVDHAYARWFTLALWLGTATATAWYVWQVARASAAAWFAGVAVFLFLHQFSEEAFHPGVVVVFLLPVLLATMQKLAGSGQYLAGAAVAGAGTATLGLLKINVGVLFAVALLVWVIVARGGSRFRLLGVAAGLLLAAGLMFGLIGAVWVWIFLAVIGTGLTGLAWAAGPEGRLGRGAWVAYILGAGVTAAGLIAAVAGRGSSGSDLLAGVLLRPLQHAGSYSYAVDWRPGTLLAALAAIVLFARWHTWMTSGRTAAAECLLVVLRLLLLGGLLLVLALLETYRVIGVLFSYSFPWLWVWVVTLPRPAEAPAGPTGRSLLAWVLLFQVLHAYPVGGIQICWGSFLLFPLVAMTLPETCAWLAARRSGLRRAAWLVVVLPVTVAAAKAVWTARSYHATYGANTALALPGAAGLRLSEHEAVACRALVLNSVLHADRLFSLPGMFSYNLWSGLPTPSLRNTTLWYALLTVEEQQEIVVALEQARRPALVVDASLVRILHGSGAPPAGPLYAHLLAHFRPAFAFHGLGFWVRKGRTVLPVGTAWRMPPGRAGMQVCLIGLARPVAQVELRDAEQPAGGSLILDANNSRVVIQSMNLDGTPRAAPIEGSWPLRSDGPAWITIHSDALRDIPRGASPLLEFKAADDAQVASALVVDGG